MGTAVLSLWPGTIRAAALPPLVILKGQAAALAVQTDGVLEGEVIERVDPDDQHHKISLDIMVPELEKYRHRVLAVFHAEGHPYPALVDAEVFRTNGGILFGQWDGGLPGSRKAENQADTEDELIGLVTKVFESPYIVSVAQGLIARVLARRGQR